MKYLFCIIGLLFIVSCKKGSAEFTIKGTITDATFQQGLTGATLNLYQYPTGSNTPSLIGTTTLSSDGSYSFTFKRDKMEKYVITVAKTNYFTLNETIYFSSLSIEEDNIRNFSTTAKSWVRLRFLNENPSDLDELRYIKQQGKVSCTECCPSDYVYLSGAVDTSIYCINDGNTVYSYMYSVLNTTNTGILSVTTVPFDTTEIYLAY